MKAPTLKTFLKLVGAWCSVLGGLIVLAPVTVVQCWSCCRVLNISSPCWSLIYVFYCFQSSTWDRRGIGDRDGRWEKGTRGRRLWEERKGLVEEERDWRKENSRLKTSASVPCRCKNIIEVHTYKSPFSLKSAILANTKPYPFWLLW